MEQYEWTVSAEHVNERIDKFISTKGDWSRNQVQIWLKDGEVTVNGKRVKSNYKIQENDEIVLKYREPELLTVEPEPLPLHIIYEDKDVIVVNKKRGMVVHPAPGHTSGTLVNALMYHCAYLSGINGVIRPGIVHRIDKDTSGLLMVAKNDKAHTSLVQQLKAKTTKRVYEAIVHGVIPHEQGTIDAPIGRDRLDRKKMMVTETNSREAVTHFTVLERFSAFTYVECQLETGRTHQIRVHLNYIGFPLAGDPKYGPKKTLPIEGQALHAKMLSFVHPTTKEELTFNAPLPDDMNRLLTDLRKSRY